ncbi:hypothetical protein KBC75_01810 [Candidatus Shapirobacteria bacterium]|nr:hypothetical protein [Candidatus Shapirobacteria bacterium]
MGKLIDAGTIFILLSNDGKAFPTKYQPHVVLEITKRRPLSVNACQLFDGKFQKTIGGTATRRNIGEIIGFINVNEIIKE